MNQPAKLQCVVVLGDGGPLRGTLDSGVGRSIRHLVARVALMGHLSGTSDGGVS